MSWENYGIYWEIDHIKPLSKGGSFHYKNTQPLTIPANRSKSNKYEKLSEFNSLGNIPCHNSDLCPVS